MKKIVDKIGKGVIIIMLLFAAIIAHELIVFLAKGIPFPVALGMIGGFGFGYLYFKK